MHHEGVIRIYSPTRGCTIKPDNGPAKNTSDIQDLLNPKLNRNGEAEHVDEIISQKYTFSTKHNTPYDISTDQKTDTPNRPIVIVGRFNHCGPSMAARPAHRDSVSVTSWPSSIEKPNDPVMRLYLALCAMSLHKPRC